MLTLMDESLALIKLYDGNRGRCIQNQLIWYFKYTFFYYPLLLRSCNKYMTIQMCTMAISGDHMLLFSCVQQMMPSDVVQIECPAVYVLAHSWKVMLSCDAESGLFYNPNMSWYFSYYLATLDQYYKHFRLDFLYRNLIWF